MLSKYRLWTVLPPYICSDIYSIHATWGHSGVVVMVTTSMA